MEKWSSKIISQIDNKLENARERDLRFFRVDEFKRNVKRVDTFSKSCSVCQKEKIYISEVVGKIDAAISVPGKTRREYDRIISRLATHMQKTHGYYSPFFFTYSYAFFGIVAGIVLGYLLTVFFPVNYLALFSGGISAGLIVGYLWGGNKDKKIRAQKKLM